jgi:hypothetical protein
MTNSNLKFTQEIISGEAIAITDGDTFKLLTKDSITQPNTNSKY